jgi:hypothetical protein
VTEFEAEVARVVDVLAVRSVPDGECPTEVHVLASPGRDVRDIAADVHSLAVLRGVMLEPIDIHVVQLSPTEVPDVDGQDDEGVDIDLRTPLAPPPPTPRVEIDSVSIVSSEGASRAVANVRLGSRTATGTATFVPAAAALRRGVAEAALAALLDLVDASSLGELAIDNAVVLSIPPHDIAIVTLAVVSGITEQTLVGAVLVGSAGANDALARAVLDATNRRLVGRVVPPA